MPSDQTFVIVGASLAGAKAAETLREEGFDGRVVLVGAETERPYERPPLSKDYLQGKSEREKAYVHEASYYADNDIELRTGATVVSLDPGRREIALASGERLGPGPPRDRAGQGRAPGVRPAAPGHRRRAAAPRHPGRRSRRRALPA